MPTHQPLSEQQTEPMTAEAKAEKLAQLAAANLAGIRKRVAANPYPNSRAPLDRSWLLKEVDRLTTENEALSRLRSESLKREEVADVLRGLHDYAVQSANWEMKAALERAGRGLAIVLDEFSDSSDDDYSIADSTTL